LQVKKDITLIISSLAGGGAEQVCVTLANGFNKCNWRVQLVVLNLKNPVYLNQLDDEIKLIVLNKRHARSSVGAFYKFVTNNQPSFMLVFNHEIAIVLVFLRMVYKFQFKIIARNISTLSLQLMNTKSIWHSNIKKLLLNIFYNRVDKIISQSEMMRVDLINHFNLSAEKIVTIKNPIPSKIEKSLSSLEISEIRKDNIILFVGRLEHEKGLDFLIKAFANVLKQNIKLKLKILGTGSLLPELQNQIENLGLQQHVEFAGFKSDIFDHFVKARLTVQTSLFEGFPNVLLESIAVGTPVVAFDCKSGPREIIENGVNGFLVNYLDVNHLEEMIIRALNFKWERKKIQDTVKDYRIENILKSYINTLNELN